MRYDELKLGLSMDYEPNVSGKLSGRSLARHKAMSILYQLELLGLYSVLRDFDEITRLYYLEESSFLYALLKITTNNLEEIDNTLKRYTGSAKWENLPPLEKAILRLGAAQILYGNQLDGVPASVAIDEAVEQAKRYGYRNFHKFVNAILDKLRRELEGVKVDEALEK